MKQYLIYIADLEAFRLEAAEIYQDKNHPANVFLKLDKDGDLDFDATKTRVEYNGNQSEAVVKTDLVDELDSVVNMKRVGELDGDIVTFYDEADKVIHEAFRNTEPVKMVDEDGNEHWHTPTYIIGKVS